MRIFDSFETDSGDFDVVAFRELHDAVMFAEGRLHELGLTVQKVSCKEAHGPIRKRMSFHMRGDMRRASMEITLKQQLHDKVGPTPPSRHRMKRTDSAPP